MLALLDCLCGLYRGKTEDSRLGQASTPPCSTTGNKLYELGYEVDIVEIIVYADVKGNFPFKRGRLLKCASKVSFQLKPDLLTLNLCQPTSITEFRTPCSVSRFFELILLMK